MHVALSESYPEFVRSGLISVLPGRVTALEDSQGDAVARVRNAESETLIEVSSSVGRAVPRSLSDHSPTTPSRTCVLIAGRT